MRPMGLWISNNRLKVREEEEEERGGDRPSRKVEERHPRSERARGTNEDRYITLDHLLAKSFENVLIVFALESVTEARGAREVGLFLYRPILGENRFIPREVSL